MPDQRYNEERAVRLLDTHDHPLDPLAGRQRITNPALDLDIQIACRIRETASIVIAGHMQPVTTLTREALRLAIDEKLRIAACFILEGDKTVFGIRRPEKRPALSGLQDLGRQLIRRNYRCRRFSRAHSA